MLISIIMPVYNAEHYLNDCLLSIRRQSHTNWELIAVNDGSTDQSSHIMNDHSKLDARIRTIDLPKSGIIRSLQRGYELANGDLITRMDADDIMPKEKLATLIQGWNEHGLGHLITGNVKYFSGHPLGNGYLKYEKWINNLGKTRLPFKEIFRECVIPSCGWLIHRTDFENCLGFESKTYPEDYDLCFRFYENNLKVISTEKVIHFWRDHPSRSSRNDPNYLDNNFLQLKLHYFLKLELEKACDFVLWGAGKKGKALAKMLLEKSIEFRWITNNVKKQDIEIYGKRLEKDQLDKLDTNDSKIIIAVANEEERLAITNSLTQHNLVEGEQFFCFA